MRLHVATMVIACLAGVGAEGRAAPSEPSLAEPITLTEAIALAFAYAPQVATLDERIEEARGNLVTAETYRFNPELGGEAGRRSGGEDAVIDYAARLGQVLEIGGQRGLRESAARAELQSMQRNVLRAKQELAAAVSVRFIDALEARAAVHVAEANLELARNLVGVSKQRLELGAGTQLDVNVASVELVRSQRQLLLARSAYRARLVSLAEIIGSDVRSRREPAGELPLAGLEPVPPLESLLENIVEHRADLAALEFDQTAAEAQISLARREVIPDLRVEGFIEREDGTDTIIGVGLSLPIPLWNRNQGEIRAAGARQRRVSAEAALRRRAVLSDLVAAYEVYVAARQSYTAMREGVLGKLEQNLELLRKSFEAGKVGWTDVLVLRRSFVDAERELVEAAADAERARVRLELSAGTLPVPLDPEGR